MIEEEIVIKEDQVKKYAKNVLIEEYKKYLKERNKCRKNLARWNKNIINKLRDTQSGIRMSERELYNIKSKSLNNQSSKLTSLSIPKGIFVFPTPKSFSVANEHELKYMFKFESFKQYENIIPEVSDSIQEWFTEYPRNKEDNERILNQELILISFVKMLAICKNVKIIHIIEVIAELINRKVSAVYSIVSKFLKRLSKKSKKNSYNLKDSIITFRNYFCNICFKYNCNLHYCIEENIIDIAKEVKILKKKTNKLSLDLQYKNSIHNKQISSDNLKKDIVYEKIIKCKDCSDDKDNNEISLSELYIIQLYMDVFTSDCLISKLLCPQISCKNIKKVKESIRNGEIRKLNDLKSIELKPNIVDLSKSKQPQNKLYLNQDVYPEFIPCSHSGACKKDVCQCIKGIGLCEIFCNCKDYCNRQFEGCQCVGDCTKDCICEKSGRECDPDLCKNCYYDFSKFNDDKDRVRKIRKIISKQGLCKNIFIGLNLSLKTVLGKSHLCDGLGLFTLEDIEKDEFICEYTGEIITRDESDRRSIIKDPVGLNYLFTVTKQHDIDAYRAGNEMRYVNHSDYGYENCSCRKKYVRCNYRIALYANRRIEAFEELYFNYCIKLNLSWLHRYNKYYRNDINALNISE